MELTMTWGDVLVTILLGLLTMACGAGFLAALRYGRNWFASFSKVSATRRIARLTRKLANYDQALQSDRVYLSKLLMLTNTALAWLVFAAMFAAFAGSMFIVSMLIWTIPSGLPSFFAVSPEMRPVLSITASALAYLGLFMSGVGFAASTFANLEATRYMNEDWYRHWLKSSIDRVARRLGKPT